MLIVARKHTVHIIAFSVYGWEQHQIPYTVNSLGLLPALSTGSGFERIHPVTSLPKKDDDTLPHVPANTRYPATNSGIFTLNAFSKDMSLNAPVFLCISRDDIRRLTRFLVTLPVTDTS